MARPEVLIVGAGPTGLVLALWLTRLGVRVRIVDKTAEPGTTSRALAVHARILELYRQAGIAAEVVEGGLKMMAANLWVKGHRVGHAPLGDMGKGLTPFPYVIIFPQDEHERFLVGKLEALGVRVERNTEVLAFEEVDGAIRARVRMPDGGEEMCEADYIAGCDGAHSIVREAVKAGFPGGTYEHLFYVADVTATGPVMNRELHAALDTADFLAVFPLKAEGRARFVGTVLAEAVAQGRELTWDAVSKDVVQRMAIEVREIHWLSTYRVHHRVAPHFRTGRAFLLGDAAHIHSPVGGQGMNTGIGDAINLAWKLAAVLRGEAAEKLLASYEPERRAFAQRLVASTDRAFMFIAKDGPLARFVRLHIAPRVIPMFLRSSVGRRLLFRTISQIGVEYRDSPLSEGRAGPVHGGDRMPWVRFADGADNFTPLASMRWQVHIHGNAKPELAALCRERKLALETFAWSEAAAAAGLERDALYLVRPDAYVGLADREAGAARLSAYLEGLKETAPRDRA